MQYNIEGEVGPADTFTVRAHTADFDGDVWYLIELPTGQTGWLSWAVAGLAQNAQLQQVALAATIPATPTATHTPTITATPTLPPGADARTVGDHGVNLRTGPSLDHALLTTLDPLTPLRLVGRTPDTSWFEVMTYTGLQGWILGSLLDLFNPAPAQLAITWVETSGGTVNLPPATLAQIQAIFQRGRSLGNNPNAFILLGDSVTDIPGFFRSFSSGNYNLGNFEYLQNVIDAYRQSGSFGASFDTIAHGMTFSMLVDAAFVNPSACPGAAHLIECEYQRKRPSVAIIYLGINDACQNPADLFERDLHRALQYLIDHGVIPIITTFSNIEQSPCWERSWQYLPTLRQVTTTYNIPLLDFRAAAAALPHSGTMEDGAHLTFREDRHIAFTGEENVYGNTLRELMTLQMLYAVRSVVLQ